MEEESLLNSSGLARTNGECRRNCQLHQEIHALKGPLQLLSSYHPAQVVGQKTDPLPSTVKYNASRRPLCLCAEYEGC